MITTHKVKALIPVPWHRRQPVRPVTRVMDMVIWPGGYTRQLTRPERFVLWLRLPLRLKSPTPEQDALYRMIWEAEDRAFLFGGGRHALPR